jgi:hypothetical protein
MQKLIRLPQKPRLIPNLQMRKRITHVRHVNGLLESANTFANSMHYVAKGIILFTMFYSSMNWLYYKRMREEIEKQEKDKKK